MTHGIRANVWQMTPYSPGKPISEVKRELGLETVVKLASNENPLGPSPKAVTAVQDAARDLNLYPDGAAYDLKRAISQRYGMPEERIALGNGSDEIIHLLGLLYLGSPEDEVIVGDPSFVRYDAAANLAPSKLIKVPLDSDLKHDLVAMAARATGRTKLIFIANPNNPTGTIVGKNEFNSFLRDVPEGAIVVLDEAYFEFACDEEDYPDSADYVREGAAVVGLRTFSKAYGLAGIRLGFAFAATEIVDGLERAREPFNVNSLAQAAGVAALSDFDHVRRTVENNRRGKARIVECLRSHGAKTWDSYGNFVFADLGRPSTEVFQALLRKGVIVRSGEIFGTPNCVRITIGTESEMDLCIASLGDVLEPGRVSV